MLTNHDERLTVVTDGLSSLTETVTHNANTLQSLGDGLYAFQARTLWQRLRWLVTGL